jgi:hypothetical protein
MISNLVFRHQEEEPDTHFLDEDPFLVKKKKV